MSASESASVEQVDIEVRELSLWRQLLAAVFYPFLLCISLPLEIYESNAKAISVHYSYFYGDSILIFTAMAVLFFLAIRLARSLRWFIAVFLLALALCAWVSSSFFKVNYGVFNGADLTVDIWSAAAILELGAWAAIFLFTYLAAKHSKLLWDAAGLLFSTIAAFTLFNAYQVYRSEPTLVQNLSAIGLNDSGEQAYFDKLSSFSVQKNILHVILDETQGSVFKKALAKHPDVSASLKGFFLFGDTAANYPYTQISLPAIFSGEAYDNTINKQDYLKRALSENNFFKYIKSAGYSRNMHTHFGLCTLGYLDQCSGIRLVSSSGVFLMLLDFALLRSAPQSATNLLYSHSTGLFSQFLGDADYSSTTTGMAYITFKEMIDNFRIEEPQPAYKVFHSLISHAPLVLDADCKLLAQAAPNKLQPMIEQIRCSMDMLSQLLAKLEQEGILDNTLVIVSSDHGGNYITEPIRAALKEHGIPPADFSRADAMLLVKPFNSRGELTRIQVPAQLSQIAMIIRLLDSDDAIIDDVVAVLESQQGERRFNAMAIGLGVNDTEHLTNFRSYCIDGPVVDLANWRKLDLAKETDCKSSAAETTLQ